MNKYSKEDLRILMETLLFQEKEERKAIIREYGIDGTSSSYRRGYTAALSNLMELLE